MKDLKKISKPQIESEEFFVWIRQIHTMRRELHNKDIINHSEFREMKIKNLLEHLTISMDISQNIEKLIEQKEKLENLLIKNM
jgi:hypothetical protein